MQDLASPIQIQEYLPGANLKLDNLVCQHPPATLHQYCFCGQQTVQTNRYCTTCSNDLCNQDDIQDRGFLGGIQGGVRRGLCGVLQVVCQVDLKGGLVSFFRA